MRKVLFLFTLFAFLLTSPVWAADISGTWKVDMKSPMGGDESFNMDIKAAGENLTITVSDHPVIKTMEGTGTLKGNAVNMSLKGTGDMAIEIALKGTVAGNKMSGTREFIMSGGGERGAPGGEASGASAESGAREGGPPGGEGGERGAPPGGEGGERGAPPGGEGGDRGAPPGGAGGERGAPPGGEASGASAESGAPEGGPPGGGGGEVSDAFTAVKI